MVNNTLVNDLGRGAAVLVGDAVTEPVLFQNNVSVGSPTLVAQPEADIKTNCDTADPRFVGRAAGHFHLQSTSPCAGVGSAAGSGDDGFALTPTSEYVHPTSERPRPAA